ncbi:MAG: hypothetical protein WAW00_00685 [Candidatus Moraniibacteriota bacterium]
MFVLGQNKKKTLLVFLFVFAVAGGVFTTSHFFTGESGTALACEPDCVDGTPDDEPAVDTGTSGGGWNWTANPIKWVLYGIWWLLSLLLNAGVALYIFVIHPTNFEQLFNLKSVYEMWKFVRDFFNLFFILVLLYIAFTVVFQIQKDFKKALLSLVLAALLINFSFPISRFLIDATNVPMYFFVNQTNAITQHGDGGMSAILSASQLEGILLKEGIASDVADFLLAIIFTFLLAVSVMVLAVMMVVRLIALVILVIFSAAGFAASIIPGMEQYSKMWWENFWKYALFGPAAGLMLLISVRFMTEAKGGVILQGAKNSVAQVTAGQDSSNIIVSLSLAAIPLILLWFTIGLAQKMSIAGASSVVGAGQKFSKWAGKKFSGYSAAERNIKAYGAARKKRDEEKNKNNWGARLGKFTNKTQDAAYGATGLPGSKAARQRVKDMQNKEIYEKAEENKKNGVSSPELRAKLHSSDATEAAAAAMSLSERKAINDTGDLTAALQALGNNSREVSALINGSNSKAFENIDGAMYRNIVNSKVISDNPDIKKQFDAQIKGAGNAEVLVDYEIDQLSQGGVTPSPAQIASVFDKMLKGSAKDAAKSGLLSTVNTRGGNNMYIHDAKDAVRRAGPRRVQAVNKAAAEEGVGNYSSI